MDCYSSVVLFCWGVSVDFEPISFDFSLNLHCDYITNVITTLLCCIFIDYLYESLFIYMQNYILNQILQKKNMHKGKKQSVTAHLRVVIKRLRPARYFTIFNSIRNVDQLKKRQRVVEKIKSQHRKLNQNRNLYEVLLHHVCSLYILFLKYHLNRFKHY